MRRAEEALEAKEKERKLQAELAKQQQKEKQNAFRRSVLLRQEVSYCNANGVLTKI